MKNILKNEKGDLLIIFAFTFAILLGFVAFIIDIGFAYMQRSSMMEIAQVMRDTRFTKDASITDLILHSNYPGYTAFTYLVDQGRENGFKGEISITYNEYKTTKNERRYNIDIKLQDTYNCTTMKLFGIDSFPITVEVAGSGYKEKYGGTLWYPPYIDNGTRVSPAIE